jgi:hypothetical protein
MKKEEKTSSNLALLSGRNIVYKQTNKQTNVISGLFTCYNVPK